MTFGPHKTSKLEVTIANQITTKASAIVWSGKKVIPVM